jgi:bla regulator protein BlaR1
MSLLVWAGLSNAVCAAVLALAAFLVGRRCRHPAVLHALWLLVLVKLVTPPLWPVPIGWLAEETPAAVRPAAVPAPLFVVAEPPLLPSAAPGNVLPTQGRFPEKKTPAPSPRRQVARAEEPAKEPPLADPGPQTAFVASLPLAEAPAPAETSQAGGIASLLGVVWLAGTAVWLACAAVRIVRFQQLLRHARPAPEEVQELARRLAARLGLARCPAVRLLPGPLPILVWAVGRPAVYFPAGLIGRLGEEEQASLLIHELAHIRRRDHWVRWLEVLVLSLYWWYPLAWWARKQVQEREEECCDAWVVGESSPRVYALAILATVDYLAEPFLPLPAVASGLGGKEILKRRLTLIVAGKTSGRLSGPALAALLAVAAVLPLAPAPGAAEKKPAEPPKETQQPGADKPDREPVQFDQDPTVFQPLDGRLWSLAISPDGKTVASAVGEWNKPGELVLWDAASGKPRVRVREDKGLLWIAYSPDGKWLATATASFQDHTAGGGNSGPQAAIDMDDPIPLAGHDFAIRLWDPGPGERR